jgi:hypothetical protein
LILYHYTDQKGYEGIKGDRFIRPTIAGGRDAAAGTGIYLTSIPPSTVDPLKFDTSKELSKRLFGLASRSALPFTKYYFALEMEKVENVESIVYDKQGELRTGIFICRRDSDLEIDDILLDHGGPLWS